MIPDWIENLKTQTEAVSAAVIHLTSEIRLDPANVGKYRKRAWNTNAPG
jgi:hypothetical protein